MKKAQILKCNAREILDSRGHPTVEATVLLTDGTVGVASVPSGASTGEHEAVELRDGDSSRYGGKGVLDAVCNICLKISPAISGVCVFEQAEADRILIELDGSESKENLGANATLAVSLAIARAAANSLGIPLYRYLGGSCAYRLPVPMLNILNGGAHANNNMELQEFMIVPVGAESFSEALRISSEIYHKLGSILKSLGHSTGVGDEGGFAPDLESDEEAIELILKAIKSAGYSTDTVKLALDAAASEWYSPDKKAYVQNKRGITRHSDELIEYYRQLCSSYPIISIEDGLDQNDFTSWATLTSKLSGVMTVGDDLYVTSAKRLDTGIREKASNSILIKPNQIGSLTETLEVIRRAKNANMNFIVSHRSGETEDTTIADIAVGTNAPFVKFGAPCRSERTAKYNRLIRIESSLNSSARYFYR